MTSAGLASALWWTWAAARHGRLGVDLIALLALTGTLVVGEYLAGAVIAVMLATGRSLESWASGRASRELLRLVERAPTQAHLQRGGGFEDVPVSKVAVGDVVRVLPGEVVPVDGLLRSDGATIDESALTGEPLPVERDTGEPVRSGTVNVGGPVELAATSTAETSAYAGIVRLVQAAESESAPAVRIADRYALWFVGVTLVASTAAGLAAGGLSRAVAVLVVATPCPLILAVPVALVSGLSLCAHRGVIVKGGAVLERLAASRVLMVDKTGTLTAGHPQLIEVLATPSGRTGDDVLELAASVDQLSPHVLAVAIVRAARERGVALRAPHAVEEVHGQGIRGQVDGQAVAVGKASWAGEDPHGWSRRIRRRADREGFLTVFVGVDGQLVGALLLADAIRPDAARTIRYLRAEGIDRVMMVTGDRTEVAETVGSVIGVDEVMAERTPAEKLEALKVARRVGPTVMVGDGINDAPALAGADVGVAIGARGATASSEAADAVLAVDRLDRIGDAIAIARRSLRIATQSVVAGMGLSLAAMGVAAVGLLPATWGAITQELIDVAVILNALRALQPAYRHPGLGPSESEVTLRFSTEHTRLRPRLDQVRAAADSIGRLTDRQALELVQATTAWLTEDLLPHEEAEEQELLPVMARVLGGEDRTSTMSRAHAEIAHRIRQVSRLCSEIYPPADPEDMAELRRLLYGLHAILELHFAQEDESYLSIGGPDEDARVGGRAPGGNLMLS